MSNSRRQLLVFALLSFFSIFSFLTPPLIQAQAQVITITNPLRAQSFDELILNIVNFLFTLAIPITIIMIIIGGFMFITASGEPSKIQQGKQLILWASVGLIVILLSRGLIDLLRTIF